MVTQSPLGVLSRDESLEALQTVRVGRLAFTEDGLPTVQPVNFRVWQGDIVIRVAGGTKLDAAVDNHIVAFEADELEPELRGGWSVTVVGHAQLITEIDDLVAVSGAFLQPWAEGRREHFVRIRAERVTGRRLEVSPAQPG